jgi:hypothetical protein
MPVVATIFITSDAKAIRGAKAPAAVKLKKWRRSRLMSAPVAVELNMRVIRKKSMQLRIIRNKDCQFLIFWSNILPDVMPSLAKTPLSWDRLDNKAP